MPKIALLEKQYLSLGLVTIFQMLKLFSFMLKKNLKQRGRSTWRTRKICYWVHGETLLCMYGKCTSNFS